MAHVAGIAGRASRRGVGRVGGRRGAQPALQMRPSAVGAHRLLLAADQLFKLAAAIHAGIFINGHSVRLLAGDQGILQPSAGWGQVRFSAQCGPEGAPVPLHPPDANYYTPAADLLEWHPGSVNSGRTNHAKSDAHNAYPRAGPAGRSARGRRFRLFRPGVDGERRPGRGRRVVPLGHRRAGRRLLRARQQCGRRIRDCPASRSAGPCGPGAALGAARGVNRRRGGQFSHFDPHRRADRGVRREARRVGPVAGAGCAAWIVDALLGTGSRGEPRPPLDAAIDRLNAAAAPKLAVDLPSGLDCQSGQPAAHTVRAADTCTFVAVKTGFLNPAAAPYLGRLHVLDIGVPRKLVERATTSERGS